jgi:hypothetical protein
MAASIESEDFVHRIGSGSTYDIDMDFTENLVRSYKYPENERFQYIVYQRYMSDTLSYFTRVEEYIISDQPFKDLKKDALMKIKGINEEDKLNMLTFQLEKIKSKFELIKNKFDDLISSIEEEYLENKVVNPEDFMEIFYFISLIFCISPLKKILNSNYRYRFEKNAPLLYDENGIQIIKKLYPLTNNTGLFDINCYMYALFSGIYLIGVPSQVSHYDGLFGCPGLFFEHDIGHTYDEVNNEDIDKFKNLYIAVLSNEDFSREEKELHVLTMWYIIHETEGEFSAYKEQQMISDTIDEAFLQDFLPEFKRFAEFVINAETGSILYEHKELLTKKTNISILEYEKEDFDKIINTKGDSFLYALFLCYASFMYSFNQISSTFPDLINQEDY